MDITIEKRVNKIIAEQLGVIENEINPENNLTDDLGADSLDKVELVMALEDEFEIQIKDDDADRCDTVQQVIDLIKAAVPT